MCGLLGIVSRCKVEGLERQLKQMSDAIIHRGPDDAGIFINGPETLGLAHRRLSIQDLSPLGHQPMLSATKRFVVVYNGEIYNFKSLRAELELLGHRFISHSDTEVMLAGFEEWGIITTIQKCTGMFAIAVYDQQLNKLTLIRDRFGEKPLYYSLQQGALLFGSELHSFRACPDFNSAIDRNSLALLVRHNFIPAPHSIYQNTYKLLPGQFIEIDLENLPRTLSDIEFNSYWELNSAVGKEQYIDFTEAVNTADSLLKQSIERQMISDAPLGAFLSGGIDSSTVVALMQDIATQPVKTFSIGFNEKQFNEAEHAKAVAQHLKTNHTELYVSGADALELIPKIPQIYDEPFADSSQLPTYLLCQMAKKEVTVALSGDGGDELFCGYSRYFQYQKAWNNTGSLKHSLKQAALSAPMPLQMGLSKLLHKPSRKLDRSLLIAKLAREKSLGANQLNQFYKAAVSINQPTDHIVLSDQSYQSGLDLTIPDFFAEDELKSMMYMDLNWYLPDDILVKVDRAAMANSLETRVPMLDHSFAEFALSLPTSLNVKQDVGKQVLRSVLYRYVPKELIERPKVGFAIPIDEWLRGDLKEWSHALLEPTLLRQQGYFNQPVITSMLEAHNNKVANYGYQLWGILMFQQWLLDVEQL